MTRPSRHQDEGVALLLAIIFVAIVGAIAGAVVSLASTNLRTTGVYTSEAGMSTAADGAVQLATNTVRRTLYNASVGQHCFPDAGGSLISGSDTLSLPAFAAESGRQYSATVVCSHSGGSSSPVLINASNRPGTAILTTGNRVAQGEPGISIKALNAVPFLVHGVIYSNSSLNMVSGTLLDDNGVYVKGSCSGGNSITPTPACNFTGSTPSGADPGYAAAVNSVPAYVGSATYGNSDTPLPLDRSNPPNACKNTIVKFTPGYYDDAVALSTLMTNSGCAGSTFWFRPGTYYFDFHNGDTVLPSGSHVWSVNTGALVAGTPSTANRLPVVSPTIPGSCVNPISEDNSATDRGVQFIFGGDSQFVADAASVEICGTYSASSPPISVFGVPGAGDEAQSAPALVMTSGSAGVVNAGAFATVPNVEVSDSQYATWTNSKANGKDNTSFTVRGFAPSTAIPAGSIVDSASLRVAHGYSGANSSGRDTRSVDLTLNGQSMGNVPLTSPANANVNDETVPITGAVLTAIRNSLHSTGYTGGGQATYNVSTQENGTERVDILQLNLTYRKPAFRGEALSTIHGTTNCLTQAYTGTGNGSCAVVSSTQAPNNHFYIQGTAYAPAAVMDISLNQATSQVFKFGVVARSLQIKVTGSSTFDQPVIEIPDDSPGSVVSTNLILSAYVCPGSTACAVTGTPWLRARIAIIDPDPGSVLMGLRGINIQSWAIPLHSGG